MHSDTFEIKIKVKYSIAIPNTYTQYIAENIADVIRNDLEGDDIINPLIGVSTEKMEIVCESGTGTSTAVVHIEKEGRQYKCKTDL